MKPLSFLFVLAALMLLFSCRKESFTYDSGALLQTSVDTLHFDTLFATVGSVVQPVKIINNNNMGIHIGSIRLAGGNGSPFKINVNGVKGPDVYNIDIASNDSAYIFVTASIKSNLITNAFLINDSIEIAYNGNKKIIQLDAIGQNAHFFRNRLLTSDETWDNDLPYVILGRITIGDNTTLTINKGCRVYMHADAPFIISGSLKVLGERYDSTRVTFTGDRLDNPYRYYPASYPGLIFTAGSKNNSLDYAIIKNAYQGIAITEPANTGTKLLLNQVIIDNAYDAGIAAMNTSIVATNLLVSNCGKNLVITNGGNYNFTHCTVSTFTNNFIQHKDPVLNISNAATPANPSNNSLIAVFRNCIFWGDDNGFVNNEVVVGKNDNAGFNVSFDHILWREQEIPSFVNVAAAINAAPMFDSINTYQRYYNFRLKASSPAIKSGIAVGVAIDLDGQPRPGIAPDIGCYQRQ